MTNDKSQNDRCRETCRCTNCKCGSNCRCGK